jgi:hypothetical protein
VDLVVDFINTVIEQIGNLVTFLIGLLPPSPFVAFQNLLSNDILSMVNWFIPLEQMIGLLDMWLKGILTWYAISVILRVVKLRQ